MISKHRFMALMISASMGLSMLASPVAVLAAEETPVVEEAEEAVTGEAPAAEEPEEAAPAEDVQEPAAEPAAETEDAVPVEEKAAAVDEAEETDESVPAEAVEEAVVTDDAEAEPAAEAEEEIKETAVEALQGVWEGEGIYSWENRQTGALVGYKYMYTEKTWHTGFKNIGGDQYYFDPNNYGYMKTGWFTVNGFKYYGSTAATIEKGRGILYTGMKVIGGHHYYFFVSTKDGHYGKTMAKNSWVSTGGQKFYAGSDGKLISGFKTIGGKGYYFYPSGTSSHKYGQMAKGWFTYNGFKYHAASSGVLDTGFKTIDGVHYYFFPKTSGKNYAKTMAKGWFTANGFKYYANSSGSLVTGWQTIGGVKYYFWPTTANGHYSRTMACNGTFTIGGVAYKFASNGTSSQVKAKYDCDDLVNFLNKKGIYKTRMFSIDETDCGSYYRCWLCISQGDGAPSVSTNATINKTTGYATVDWNGWEGINWSNANKYTSFYVTK